MNPMVLLVMVLFILLGIFLGVSGGFFQHMGANIGKNHMRELGFDDREEEISEEDETLLYHNGKIGSKHLNK